MPRYVRFALIATGVFCCLGLAQFLFATGAMRFRSLGAIEQRLNPPQYIFWQGGNFYSTPPLFSQAMTDTEGRLAPTQPEHAQEIDLWVFLLEGFEDVRNIGFASGLGLAADDIEAIAATPESLTVDRSTAKLGFRIHPLPFYVQRKRILFINAMDMRANYRNECMDELVYGRIIQSTDQSLLASCRKN